MSERFIEFIQRQKMSKTKLLMWLLFAIQLVGIWSFQHIMISSAWRDCNLTPSTVGCIFVILFLLPYSLSHKVRFKSQWYSLAFIPSLVLSMLLSQERISLTCVIAAVVALVALVILVCRQPFLPGKPIANNLFIYIIASVYTSAFSNTDVLTHYKYDIMHYEEAKQYEKALQIGAKSLHVNNDVFNLRATAMLKTNTIGNVLFKYPIPSDLDSINITQELNVKQKQDAILSNLLLQKNLGTFVSVLQQWYDIKSTDLPRYYREALVLYMSKTIDTNVAYDDSAIQANYNDFVAEMKKYSDPQVRSNMCRDMYPDTYFWYYFFFQQHK